MKEKNKGLKYLTFLFIFMFVNSFFSINVYAQELVKGSAPINTPDDSGSDDEGSGTIDCALLFCQEGYSCEQGVGCVLNEPVVFDVDVAGITPDSFWYFFDFVHSPEESIHEAGLMVQLGNYEAANVAFENFAQEVESQRANAQEINIDGVNIDNIQSDPELQKLYEIQTDLLNYELYIDSINSILAEQTDNIENVVVEEVINTAEDAIASVGVVIEARATEAIEEAAETSNVPSIQVDFAFEEGLQTVAEQRYPDSSPRFQEIAGINDIQELKIKISELRAEIASLEESGAGENLDEVKDLLRMAESHGVYCLHADESELGITADIHLNAAEDFLSNAEDLLEGEIEIADVEEELEHAEVLTAEEIQAEVQGEQDDAQLFTDNYENLKETYANDPVKLTVLNAENERLKKVEELGNLLYGSGVMDKWTNELTSQGLTGNELEEAIHERWVAEWENIYGEEYVPPGLYTIPGTEEDLIRSGLYDPIKEGKEGEQELEVIGIGRVDIIEVIDPETGEVTKQIEGWYDGEAVENVQEGGGYALGVSYLDPDSGIYYVFNDDGYSYTTPAGIVNVIDYPPEFSPENTYEYGDEVYSYTTEDGNVVSYSATGYEVKDPETDSVIVETPYDKERTKFIDGSFTDLEATGYVFNGLEGESRVYAYIPEFKTYQDISSGKVVIPFSAHHIDSTNYDSTTGKYQFNYGGQLWTYSGEGLWTDPSGANVQMPVVPAPVGHENIGTYTTPNGEQWTYLDGQWTESISGRTYAPAPNNHYRYNERTGFMIDSEGSRLAPVGTTVTINGETFTVTLDKGWTNAEGEAVPPPYDPATGEQYPSSMTGIYSGISYEDDGSLSPGDRAGVPGGNSNNVWSFDTANNQWVSSDTGDKYDPSTGIITHPDGTVFTPEDRAAGEGSEGCWGCYYGGEGSGTSHYTYYGGHYEGTPTGGYNYYNAEGQYQGSSSVTDSQGNIWTRNDDGSWQSSSGEAYTPGTYSGTYYGGGGYDSSGNYVGGEYGGYDSSGTYTGGATYTTGGYYTGGGYDPAAAAAGWPGGAYPGGVAPYSGPYTGPVGYSGGYYTGGGGYDSAGNYVGGEYGGYTSSGTYTGGNTYTYDSSTGTYSGGTSTTTSTGSTDSGTTGGTSTTTSTGSTDSGGSAPSGGTTGSAIANEDTEPAENFVEKFFRVIRDFFSY